MTTLLAIFTSRIAGPVASIVAVILLLFAVAQCSGRAAEASRADNAEREFALSENDRMQCVTNRMALEGSIATQNAALADLRHEAEVRTQAAEKAVTEALRGRAGAEARAAKLLKSPPSGVDACARMESADTAVLRSLQ